MGRITSMIYKPDRDRVWVYIDGQYCASIRKRTFDGMGLYEGMIITAEELKEKENYFWKQMYNMESWKKEKVRLDIVKNYIESIDIYNQIEVKEVGFGADTELMLDYHPEEAGSPDLCVKYKTSNNPFMFIEVSGTDTMAGEEYWVRPDKLEYAKRHPEKDIWIILHYQNPVEKIVIIKPDNNKAYKYKEIKRYNGATEYYVLFNDNDEDVKTLKEFQQHLKKYL